MDSDFVTDGNEPLGELAKLAWEQAPVLCDPDHGCQNYHRMWPLIRLFMVDGAMPASGDFFQKALASLAGHSPLRILISGGADSGLSALIQKVTQDLNTDVELIYVDRCATACELNRQWALYADVPLTVIQSDINELNIPPVHAVVSHTFLGFFSEPIRQQVINRWSDLLISGGGLFISQAVRKTDGTRALIESESEIQGKKRLLAQRIVTSDFEIVSAQVVELAEQFWRRVPSGRPFVSAENLFAGLEVAGFEDVKLVAGDLAPGPFTRKQNPSDRFEVSATKP